MALFRETPSTKVILGHQHTENLAFPTTFAKLIARLSAESGIQGIQESTMHGIDAVVDDRIDTNDLCQ